MLSSIFHNTSGNYWNINQILNNDELSDNNEILTEDLTIPEGDILFDNDDDENLSISECF